MSQQLRVYDLREEDFEILPVLLEEKPADYQNLLDFINDMLYEIESEQPWELEIDIIINDDKLLEDIPIPKVIGFLHDYFWHNNNIEMVTVHVMTCGKMNIMCYNDDDGLVSRIVMIV